LTSVNRFRRWYHINIKNLHRKKIVQDCTAYLESTKNLSTGEEKRCPPIEFKWRGFNVERGSFPPKYGRNLDAFYIPHNLPSKVCFAINRSMIDYSGYIEEYTLSGPGDYEMNFVLFSINFSPVHAKFCLHIENSLEDIKFYEI